MMLAARVQAFSAAGAKASRWVGIRPALLLSRQPLRAGASPARGPRMPRGGAALEPRSRPAPPLAPSGRPTAQPRRPRASRPARAVASRPAGQRAFVQQQQQQQQQQRARLVAVRAATGDAGAEEQPETAREAIDMGVKLCKDQKWVSWPAPCPCGARRTGVGSAGGARAVPHHPPPALAPAAGGQRRCASSSWACSCPAPASSASATSKRRHAASRRQASQRLCSSRLRPLPACLLLARSPADAARWPRRGPAPCAPQRPSWRIPRPARAPAAPQAPADQRQ
jgi:DNA polymerase-3 subunit gamma/tau